MKEQCILLESEYLEDGNDFQEVLKKAIEAYLKNNPYFDGQNQKKDLKYL